MGDGGRETGEKKVRDSGPGRKQMAHSKKGSEEKVRESTINNTTDNSVGRV